MIQQRNLRMRQHNKLQRRKLYKKLLTNVNVGVLLLSTSALAQAQSHSAVVHAQDQSKKISPKEFIEKIAESAKEIASKNNLYASVMIAQAALESGWGNSSLAQAPNYNLFGIKAGKADPSVLMNTLEDNGSGDYYQIKDNFRKYASYSDSLMDYARVLTGEGSQWRANYYKGALKSNTSSYQDATAHLTGRYATDTRYGGKLNHLISQYQLDQYDEAPSTNTKLPSAVAGQVTPTLHARPITPASPSNTPEGSYRVQAGDGLYAIARKNGISLQQLLQANGLTINSMIHPNQNLIIPKNESVQSATNGGGQAVTQPNQLINSQTKPTIPTTSSTRPVATSGAYTIQAGDSLWAIANRHGMTLQELLAVNNLRADSLILPGQQLRISGRQTSQSVATNQKVKTVTTTVTTSSLPTNSTVKSEVANTTTIPTQQSVESSVYVENPVSTTEQTSPMPSTNGSHVVQAKDTLYSIANRYGVDLNQLIAKNGGTTIYIGQVIQF